MAGFTSFLNTLFLGPRDTECVNNGGLTSQSAKTLYYYIDANRFRNLSVFYDISGTGPITMTIEGSNDEVAQASATYTDIGHMFDPARWTTFTAAKSWTVDAMLVNEVPLTFKWIRIKIVIGGAGSDNAVNVVARKSY